MSCSRLAGVLVWVAALAACQQEAPENQVDAGASNDPMPVQVCVKDSDCPADRPVCAVAWESQRSYCTPCRPGETPSRCQAGTHCAPYSPSPGQGSGSVGGGCLQASCSTRPPSGNCQACLYENAAPCLEASGPCQGKMDELCRCLRDRGGTCDGSFAKLWYLGKVAVECRPLVRQVADCVAECPAAASACGLPLK